MKLNLYSGYSTLAVAINASLNPVIRYFPTNENMQHLMTIMFPDMDVEYGRNYPLKSAEIEIGGNNIKISYTEHNGPTPFTPQLKDYDVPCVNALIFQPGPSINHFGLKGVGLFPIIETEINDLEAAYKVSDRILEFWTEHEHNVGRDEDGEMIPYKDVSIEDRKKDIVIPLDNYYVIAARELCKAGESVLTFGRDSETPEEVTVTNENLEISVTYESYATDYIPALDQEVLVLAMQYYKNGVPESYHWLKAVQPLDFLSLWTLELEKPYTMRMLSQVSESILFGDEIEFTIHHDEQYDSRYILAVSKTGEEARVEDHSVPEWVHAFAGLTGEGARELYEKGFPVRDMLNLRRSLKL